MNKKILQFINWAQWGIPADYASADVAADLVAPKSRSIPVMDVLVHFDLEWE